MDTAPLIRAIPALATEALRAAAWQQCLTPNWQFGNQSTPDAPIQFWLMELDGMPAIDQLWQHARPQCEDIAGKPLRVLRQYANGHTFGLGAQTHRDDERPDTYTLLYYPMPEWQMAWEGETLFYNEQGEVLAAIRPRPNRAVFFDARIPHNGRAPSRFFGGLRITIAFKLIAES